MQAACPPLPATTESLHSERRFSPPQPGAPFLAFLARSGAFRLSFFHQAATSRLCGRPFLESRESEFRGRALHPTRTTALSRWFRSVPVLEYLLPPTLPTR